ncbi:MAG TPA: hypothetical protein VFQ92_18760, partial [Blastocatellia bacterium]|nr:hypothetical protein [Blastocatellia bacterium]
MNQKHKRLLFLLLIMMGAPFTVMAQDAHPAAQEVGTYHWQDGCTQDGKVCGRQMYRDGLALLSLTVNGVSVDIVLVDTGKVMLVATSVGNDTRQTIDVVPQLFSLNAVKPKPKNLSFLAPDLFERKTGKVADSDVNWMMTALALAKSRMTTETRLSAVKGGDPASSKPDSKGKDEDESGRE